MIYIKKGYHPWNKGKKVGNGWIGKHHSQETRHKMSLVAKGRVHSLVARQKLSIALRGDKSPLWRGGVSQFTRTERHNTMITFEYKKWRKDVFMRDDFTCQMCGLQGIKTLRANHIKLYSLYPALRIVLTNGITICEDCDIKYVLRHEPEWESYFNFNLMTRGFLKDEHINGLVA